MTQQWYEVRQQHSFGHKMMLILLRFFPASVMRFLAIPIGFFYYLSSQSVREYSKIYLCHVKNPGEKVRSKDICFHIISFAINLVENVQGWAGKFSSKNISFQNDDVDDLIKNIDNGQGVLLLISHLGNPQFLKALASMGKTGGNRKIRITSIADKKISAGFNQLLNEINPESSMDIVSTDEIGPETIELLQDKLDEGEVIAIAGDRISDHTPRNLEIPFLGEKTKFPYGVFLLISLLNVPTYFITGLRKKDISINSKYDMFIKKNDVNFDCGRSERLERIKKSAENYVSNLENLCRSHPYQWYNFFDFWK